ncbi:MAG TPA: YdeI/OmpD-associated family protein [Rhodanobacteraceae bacterium]
MTTTSTSTFTTTLLRPAEHGEGEPWTFLILPKTISDTLPRRGRTSVEGTLNGKSFQATLEPDGHLSHWLKVGEALRRAAKADFGGTVSVQMTPADPEPEPSLPDDLREALAANPKAMATWDNTTTLARIDWIHWIESAKQVQTRQRRVDNACDMLASGKKRVCCFDPSGYYSKSFSAPRAAD